MEVSSFNDLHLRSSFFKVLGHETPAGCLGLWTTSWYVARKLEKSVTFQECSGESVISDGKEDDRMVVLFANSS